MSPLKHRARPLPTPILLTTQLKDRPAKRQRSQHPAAHDINRLENGMWIGHRCFIVGGGPSLKDFNFRLLRDELTIGINRAFEFFDPSIIFGMDARFWNWVEHDEFGPEVRKRLQDYRRGLKVWVAVGSGLYPEDVIVLDDAGIHAFTNDLTKGLGNGNNSGYAALNLAFILGANPIYLLGYDMRGDGQGGQQWFHDGYPKIQPDRVYSSFMSNISRFAAPALQRGGRSVINLNPNSALDCFPKQSVSDVQFGKPEPEKLVILGSSNIRSRTSTRPHAEIAAPLDRQLNFILQDNMWKGLPAFVVGGGPSLKNFDWSRLRGEPVIGINRAYEYCDPAVIFSMDSRFYANILVGRYGPLARDKFQTYRSGIKVWLDNNATPYREDVFIAKCPGRDAWPTRVADGLGGGANSGYGALNLAYVLGADPIYLLGFDMHGGPDGRQQWFHTGHPDVRDENVYVQFREAFERIAPRLAVENRTVINLNPDSALTCFPFGRISDIPPVSSPVVVAYYTMATGYEQEAEFLRQSLKPWGLSRDIVAVPNLKSWQKNTQYKARFILDMLRKHAPRPILYVDADAQIVQYPRFVRGLEASADLAVHWRDRGEGRRELLSGTIWLSQERASYNLMERWIAENAANPDTWDQRTLESILRSGDWKGRVVDLPPEYCAIFDQAMCEVPVIEHYQASRRLKADVEARR